MRCSLTPIRRQTSLIFMPPSACPRAATIYSSVKRFLGIRGSPPPRFQKTTAAFGMILNLRLLARKWSVRRVFRAATVRVCEKTGDCHKRRP